MSGSNKNYLPSQRMMPVYTTVGAAATSDVAKSSEFPYDCMQDKTPPGSASYSRVQESPKSSSSLGYTRVPEFPYDPPEMGKTSDYSYEGLQNGTKATPTSVSYNRVQESPKSSINLANYPRMQEFPYGLSGVAMPSYNYSSELYSYVSNGFPRKSRMCSYCGKVFTRSTTRRYHEKRCPLLRAAGSLLKNDNQQSGNKTDTSLNTSFSPNTSYPAASSSSQTSYCFANYTSPTYTSTSTSAVSVDQNRNAVVGIKQEPHDLADPSSTMAEPHSQGSEVSTTRFTPDFEAANQQSQLLFSPAQERSSESSLSLVADMSGHEILETQEPEVENGAELDLGNSSLLYRDAGPTYQEYDDDSHPQRAPSLLHSGNVHSSYNSEPQGTQDQSDVLISENNSGQSGAVVEKKEKPALANRCSICGKVFDTPRQLHIHEQLHTKFKPYACRFCGQRFIKVSMRIAHERLHIGEKPYVCAICGLTFTRKYSVRLHMRRRHTDGPCLCRYCGKTLYTLQTLKTHLLAHDLPKAEKESLHYLGVPSGDRIVTALGLMTKSSEIPLSLDGLDQNQGEIDDNNLYMVVHSGGNSREKEWCKMCEKEFPKSFMRYHERVHADQKPYECPTCKKRFGYKNNMKSHMKLHAGIKPYQCHVCGAKFTRGSTLRRHARRHGVFTESVWDFFVQKGTDKKEGNISQEQTQMGTQGPPPPQGQSSPDVSSTRPVHMETSAAIPDSSHNYDMNSYTSDSPVANNIYASYAAVSTIPQSIYQSYPSTSPFTVEYTGYTPSQAPQSDALNLSLHDKTRALAGISASPTQEIEGPSNVISNLCGRVSPSRSTGSVHLGSEHGHHTVGVQVNLCCSDKTTSLMTSSLGFDQRMLSPPGFDGSGTSATSPSLSSGGDIIHQESLSALVTSGKLFRCLHCDCYFTEYAMYRIHQKLHARDISRPFLCPVCGEDCHDKMYFSLHLHEHLR